MSVEFVMFSTVACVATVDVRAGVDTLVEVGPLVYKSGVVTSSEVVVEKCGEL